MASVFRTEEDYAALAEAYLTELAGVNTLYAELFVSPDHGEAVGLSAEAYIDGLAPEWRQPGQRPASNRAW